MSYVPMWRAAARALAELGCAAFFIGGHGLHRPRCRQPLGGAGGRAADHRRARRGSRSPRPVRPRRPVRQRPRNARKPPGGRGRGGAPRRSPDARRAGRGRGRPLPRGLRPERRRHHGAEPRGRQRADDVRAGRDRRRLADAAPGTIPERADSGAGGWRVRRRAALPGCCGNTVGPVLGGSRRVPCRRCQCGRLRWRRRSDSCCRRSAASNRSARRRWISSSRGSATCNESLRLIGAYGVVVTAGLAFLFASTVRDHGVWGRAPLARRREPAGGPGLAAPGGDLAGGGGLRRLPGGHDPFHGARGATACSPDWWTKGSSTIAGGPCIISSARRGAASTRSPSRRSPSCSSPAVRRRGSPAATPSRSSITAVLKLAALIRYRAIRTEPRAYRVPLNVTVRGHEWPLGLDRRGSAPHRRSRRPRGDWPTRPRSPASRCVAALTAALVVSKRSVAAQPERPRQCARRISAAAVRRCGPAPRGGATRKFPGAGSPAARARAPRQRDARRRRSRRRGDDRPGGRRGRSGRSHAGSARDRR